MRRWNKLVVRVWLGRVWSVRSRARFVMAAILCLGLGQMGSADELPRNLPHSGIASQNGDGCYRTPEYDGMNCLYLQLRLLGYSLDYETYRKTLPTLPITVSLDSLANDADRFGVSLVPVKLTYIELTQSKQPIIIYFEEEALGNGRFMLFLSASPDQQHVELIESATIVHRRMTVDQFRRYWTGYALVPQHANKWNVWIRRVAALLVAGSVAAVLIPRSRKR